MKMSDRFSLPVLVDADYMEDLDGELGEWLGYKSKCKAAAHAINRHDKIIESLRALANEVITNGCDVKITTLTDALDLLEDEE